jgi:hypothetical protein
MAKQMQRAMPAHLKKYVGPYMQQNIMNQGMNQNMMAPGMGASEQPHFTPHASTAHFPRPDFHPTTGQNPTQPTQPNPAVAPQPAPAAGSPAAAVPATPAQPYDFIVNPELAPVKRSFSGLSLGGNSLATRLLVASAGLLLLVIIVAVFKSLLSGTSNLPSFVTVVQNQQELIHLSTNATTQAGLPVDSVNFASTAELSLTSAQSALTNYLKVNGNKKISTELASINVSSSVDSQLTAAASAGTYDQTFRQIMQTDLGQYQNSLKLAYQKTTGPKGRALLTSDYHQAQLLVTQLNQITD